MKVGRAYRDRTTGCLSCLFSSRGGVVVRGRWERFWRLERFVLGGDVLSNGDGNLRRLGENLLVDATSDLDACNNFVLLRDIDASLGMSSFAFGFGRHRS